MKCPMKMFTPTLALLVLLAASLSSHEAQAAYEATWNSDRAQSENHLVWFGAR